MKSKQDYFKKTLGLSLKGKPVAMKQKASFLFLADQDDVAKNQLMISKLLAAVKKTNSVFVQESELEQYDCLNLFSFGVKVSCDAKTYPSFTEISADPKLKAKLWSDLKKLI